jgi:hypothetical protein
MLARENLGQGERLNFIYLVLNALFVILSLPTLVPPPVMKLSLVLPSAVQEFPERFFAIEKYSPRFTCPLIDNLDEDILVFDSDVDYHVSRVQQNHLEMTNSQIVDMQNSLILTLKPSTAWIGYFHECGGVISKYSEITDTMTVYTLRGPHQGTSFFGKNVNFELFQSGRNPEICYLVAEDETRVSDGTGRTAKQRNYSVYDLNDLKNPFIEFNLSGDDVFRYEADELWIFKDSYRIREPLLNVPVGVSELPKSKESLQISSEAQIHSGVDLFLDDRYLLSTNEKLSAVPEWVSSTWFRLSFEERQVYVNVSRWEDALGSVCGNVAIRRRLPENLLLQEVCAGKKPRSELAQLKEGSTHLTNLVIVEIFLDTLFPEYAPGSVAPPSPLKRTSSYKGRKRLDSGNSTSSTNSNDEKESAWFKKLTNFIRDKPL